MRADSKLIKDLKSHIENRYGSIQYLDEGESVIKFKGIYKNKDILIRAYSTNEGKYFGDRYSSEKLCLTTLKGVISNHFVFPEIIEEFEIVNKGIQYDCMVLPWLSGTTLGDIGIISPYFREWNDIMAHMGEKLIGKYPDSRFYEDDVLNHLLSLGLNSEMMKNGDRNSILVLSDFLVIYYDLIPKTVHYLKEIDRASTPVMIHGDLHLGNIIFEEKSEPKFGIIDWEYASIGHLKSFDLAYLNYEEFVRESTELDIEQIEKLIEISYPLDICLAIALNIHWGITKLQRDLLMDKELNHVSIALIERHFEIYRIINDLIS